MGAIVHRHRPMDDSKVRTDDRTIIIIAIIIIIIITKKGKN